MKKELLLILISALCMVGMPVSINNLNEKYADKSIILGEIQGAKEAEDSCFNFINQALRSEAGGIYTNYRPKDKVGELAAGHEVLSESQGLYMLYLVKKDKKEDFDKTVQFVKDYLITEDGILLWRIQEGKENLSSGNASIDDLRIIKALEMAYSKWGDKMYKELIHTLEDSLYKYNIKDNKLYGYYDALYKNNMTSIPLCYFDLEAINYLGKVRRSWSKVYKNSLDTVEKGYLGEVFPFYAFSYDYTLGSYSEEENVRMTESILTVLHLAQVDRHRKETIDWLLTNLKSGAIYGTYDIITGKPVSDIESTAVYATIAQIGKTIGHTELYELALNKMLRWQIQDESSKLYGAFGDPHTEEVYSYDNLQALLAF